jgi:hypothetical protein
MHNVVVQRARTTPLLDKNNSVDNSVYKDVEALKQLQLQKVFSADQGNSQF